MISKILVVGDLIVDRYYFGKVNTISYEAPIPRVEILRTELYTGGACLVAENLSLLGSHVWLTGVTGIDDLSKWLKNKLNKIKVDTKGVISEKYFSTTQRNRVLTENHHVSRFDITTQRLENTEGVLLNRIKNLASKVNSIVVCDYGNGLFTDKVIAFLENLAVHKKVIISANENHMKYKHPNFIYRIKIDDAKRILGKEFRNSSAETICNKLNDILKSNRIILTLGSEGVLTYENGEINKITATHHVARDITSVGEILVAAFANAYSSGKSFTESVTIGNVAAGSAVEKLGNKTINRNGLRKALQEYHEFFSQK